MKSFRILGIGLVLGWFGVAFAQEEKKKEQNLSFGKVQELEMDLVSVPDSVGTGGKPAPAVEDSKEGYEVVPNPEAGKKDVEKFVVLTGEATYRDVPAGKKHYAGVFLPPASVLRFAGTKSGGEQDWAKSMMNLKVEATEAGAPVEEVFDLQSTKEKGPSGRGGKKDEQWNKSADAQELSGALLPIYDTPFWPKDYKRYPQPKKP